MNMLNNLKVKTQIVTGYLIILILMIIIGSVALLRLNQINSTFIKVDRWAEEQQLIGEIIAHILQIRLHANKYILDQNTSNLDHFNEKFTELEEVFTKANQIILSNGGERAQILNQLETTIQEYQTHFLTVNQLITERSQILTEIINVQGPLAEDKLEQLRESAFQADNAAAGGLTLDHIITPVINKQGERLGMVIEFNNRTIEVATEQEINTVIHAASQGDFKQRISLEGKRGFFKIFSEGINQILDFNQRAVEDIMRILAALAQGDLTQQIENNYKGTFEQLKNDINITVEKLTEMITVISKTVITVTTGAEEISKGNTNLSQRTEQQAASLEETAASMEQMTSTVQQNADNAQQASQLALSAKEQALQGGEVVNAAITAMVEINKSSQKITDIIGVIDEIAFQTNLLALNAAVESARAGEQGRGFAVVAAEVRNLAQRSAEAAKEIKVLIQDSVVKVEEGTKLANQSGDSLEAIVIAVKKVNDIINEMAAASKEQSSGVQQINQAIAQMDEMTQQNAALVEEATTASESMREQAQNLKQQVMLFKIAQEFEQFQSTEAKPVINRSSATYQTPAIPDSLPIHPNYDDDWQDF